MKNKLKKVFENAVWWSGVVMMGLVLGISFQFVKAWTEPIDPPPAGNVGAPINTGGNLQTKDGSLALLGQLITSYINIPGSTPAAGSVLTAQNASGQVAWAQGTGSGGACYVQYCNNNGVASSGEACPDQGGTQKHCPIAVFQEKAYLGTWGNCSAIGEIAYFSPPNGGCYGGHTYQPAGKAYLCCQ